MFMICHYSLIDLTFKPTPQRVVTATISNQARLSYKIRYWDFMRHSLSEILIVGSTQKQIVQFLQSWLKRSGRSLCLWLKDSPYKILINWKLGTFNTIGLTYAPNSKCLQWQLPRREEESSLSLAVTATTTSVNIGTCYIAQLKAILGSQLSYKEQLNLVYTRNIRLKSYPSCEVLI